MKNEKIDIPLWKNFLTYAKPFKKQFILIAILMVVVGTIDALYPQLTRYAIDHFVVEGVTTNLYKFIAVYGVTIIVQCGIIWLFISTAGKIEMGMAYNIRKIGFEKLQLLSLSYYDQRAVGWLMARMTSDIARLSETISWGLVDFVWGLTMMSAIMIVMIYSNWKLALITLVVVPPLVVVSLYFQKKILKAYRNVRKTNSRITGAFNEDIQGAKTTKTLVREEKNLEEFSSLTGEMRDSSIKATMVSSIYLPIVLTLGSIGTALAIQFGGKSVMLGTLSYGTLVAFISYTIQFFEPVRELAAIFAEVQSAQASAERVFSLLNEELEIKIHC